MRWVIFITFLSCMRPVLAFDPSGDYAVHYRYGITDDKIGIYPRVEPTKLNYYDYYYPFPDYGVFQYYTISENESLYKQNKNKIYLNLSAHQKGRLVVATITLSNKSRKSYFIHRLTLPQTIDGDPYWPLCSGVFIPIMDNIQLDFFKKATCRFGDWTSKSVWREVLPGEALSFDVTLNDYYIFLPGAHQYNIGTVEFTIVNSEWFSEQHIYKHFLAIVNWDIDSVCLHMDNIIYGLEKWQVWRDCGYYRGHGLFQDFLERFDYSGGNDHIFKVRSNQVVVDIDGDSAAPPYALKDIERMTVH
ncbi:hypothetical protein ACVUCS_004459 [Salmonella enterica subsp. enterica]|nr:hypothetical protein [Salmonella enterica subsp. enterica serovar Volkmarsdorf]